MRFLRVSCDNFAHFKKKINLESTHVVERRDSAAPRADGPFTAVGHAAAATSSSSAAAAAAASGRVQPVGAHGDDGGGGGDVRGGGGRGRGGGDAAPDPQAGLVELGECGGAEGGHGGGGGGDGGDGGRVDGTGAAAAAAAAPAAEGVGQLTQTCRGGGIEEETKLHHVSTSYVHLTLYEKVFHLSFLPSELLARSCFTVKEEKKGERERERERDRC